LPSPVENDYDNEYNGHYYDPVGNGRTFTPSPFVQPVTPGKNSVKIYLQLPSSSLSSCKYHYEMIYHQNKKKRLAKLLT
jgi:hypothetical protein